MAQWTLENIVKTAAKNPESFFIPNELERRSQKVGAMVRLHFTILKRKDTDPHAERMWVEIFQSMEKNRTYKGYLTNQPAIIKGLKIGDTVEFGPEHIAQTIIKQNDPRWIDSAEKNAILSEMVRSKGKPIRFMYREAPDNEEDSGWRMFSGEEDDEYANNASNMKLVNVGYLLDKDPTLLQPLKSKADVAFERTERDAPWQKIKDWQPGPE